MYVRTALHRLLLNQNHLAALNKQILLVLLATACLCSCRSMRLGNTPVLPDGPPFVVLADSTRISGERLETSGSNFYEKTEIRLDERVFPSRDVLFYQDSFGRFAFVEQKLIYPRSNRFGLQMISGRINIYQSPQNHYYIQSAGSGIIEPFNFDALRSRIPEGNHRASLMLDEFQRYERRSKRIFIAGTVGFAAGMAMIFSLLANDQSAPKVRAYGGSALLTVCPLVMSYSIFTKLKNEKRLIHALDAYNADP
jgi:hypothetical protein